MTGTQSTLFVEDTSSFSAVPRESQAKLYEIVVNFRKLLVPSLFLTTALTSGFALAQSRPTEVARGVTRQEVRLDSLHRVWIYRPKNVRGPCPLVLIAPAGSPLYCGMSLGAGDVPEHIPYAQAGCIVVAYDVSGPVVNGQVTKAAIQAFVDSDCGIKDAQRALTYALKSIPGVDARRVIAAGHSSAATIALQATAADRRIHACVAYAPIADVSGRLRRVSPRIEQAVPGFLTEVRRRSPLDPANKISRPVFLFHAKDDTNASLAPIRSLAAMGPNTKLVEVPTGGHYDSMLKAGIPAAIAWLRSGGVIKV